MLSYFLLFWDTDNFEASSNATEIIRRAKNSTKEWKVTHHSIGLVVFSRLQYSSKSVNLHGGNHGVILGKLYKKKNFIAESEVICNLSEGESSNIINTKAQILTDNYWGNYIYILKYKDKLLLGRDCTGMELCFTTWHNNIFIAFSDLNSLPIAEEIKKDVNWDYLIGCMKFNQGASPHTALKNVKEVIPGQSVSISAKTREESTDLSWNPRVFIENPTENFENAKNLIYSSTLSCVDAQLQPYNQIALALSGGLDSSIVLSSIKETSPSKKIWVYHHHSLEGDLSEENFARTVTEKYNLDLNIINSRRQSLAPLIEEAAPLFPTPIPFASSSDSNKRLSMVIRSMDIDAIFSGTGGDQIYFKRPELSAFFDYASRKGFNSTYLNVALNTSRLTGLSIWEILKQYKSYKNNTYYKKSSMRNALISEDFKERFESYALYDEHPWFTDAKSLTYGKFNQLTQFTNFPYFRNTIANKKHIISDEVNALIAQPLMESTLSIPSYLLLYKGRKRGLAREAFRKLLPEEIYYREQKGYFHKFVFNNIIESLPLIREYLLNGELIKSNLLNTVQVEEILNEDKIRINKGIGSNVLTMMDIEKWLRTIRNNTILK